MTSCSMRELLQAEQQTRWDVMYRELKRRQKALQRAVDCGSRHFEAAYMRHAEACQRPAPIDLPADTQKCLDDQWVGIEAFAAEVREVREALGRNAEQLARHERALPGLRDTDPRAILAPEPYERHPSRPTPGSGGIWSDSGPHRIELSLTWGPARQGAVGHGVARKTKAAPVAGTIYAGIIEAGSPARSRWG